jgi:hypothetical protein
MALMAIEGIACVGIGMPTGHISMTYAHALKSCRQEGCHRESAANVVISPPNLD